ncbi:DUF6912 family protein [Brachybacterium sacelli]
MAVMRIYLPLTTEDRAALESSAPGLELAAGRAVWGVHAEARADRSEEDEEDLEYDALQDAAHISLLAGPADRRALVIAADVLDAALEIAGDNGGAFGLVTGGATRARVASFHVTELDAAAAAADDTDPALLWFDASEGPDALTYVDGVTET